MNEIFNETFMCAVLDASAGQTGTTYLSTHLSTLSSVGFTHILGGTIILALIGLLQLDPITPYIAWLVWPKLPRMMKPKSGKSGKTDKTDTRWKFWSVYYHIGLKGDWRNFFVENKTMIPQIMIETLTRVLMTTTIGFVTQTLATLASQEKKIELWMPWLYFQIGVVIFSSDINNLINVAFHSFKVAYRDKILNDITTDSAIRVLSAAGDVSVQNGPDMYTRSMTSYSFSFEDITDNISELIMQLLRAVVFFSFILAKEPRMFLPFLLAYNIMAKKLIPIIMYDPKFRDLRTYWTDGHYATVKDYEKAWNPSTVNTSHSDEIEHTMSYWRLRNEYSNRNAKMSLSHYYLSFIKGIVVFGMVAFACATGGYALGILIIMSGRDVFDVADVWVRCQQIQSRAERSMDKMAEILDNVDASNDDSEKPIVAHSNFTFKNDTSFRKGITRIAFDGATVMLDPVNEMMGASKKDDPDGASTVSPTPNADTTTSIHLPAVDVDISKHAITELSGVSGLGKTSILAMIAGLMRKSLYTMQNLTIELSDGVATEIRTSFEDINSYRHIVFQFVSDIYIYNGKIDATLDYLFPNAESIDDVREFLQNVFRLRKNCIPDSLDSKPPKTLSGGERQRYILASQIWKILQTMKSHRVIVLLDEPFRNIDVETAQHIMRWIIENLDAYVFIVTHVAEIKALIRESNSLDQIWHFEADSVDETQIRVRIEGPQDY